MYYHTDGKEIRIHELIVKMADECLRSCNVSDMDSLVDIDNFVHKLNGKILYRPTNGVTVCKNADDSFTITAPDHTIPESNRFRIAQCLGHIFVNCKYMSDNEAWSKIPCNTNLEPTEYTDTVNANIFAAALLMPLKPLKEYIDEICIDDKVNLQKIATHFGVSLSVASWWVERNKLTLLLD